MNQAIRNVWIAVMVLFVAIMGSLTYVQFFAAEELSANPLNNRQLFRDFDLPRGAILVDGEPIAESVASDGQFEFQRVYHDPKLYAHLTGVYSLAFGSKHLEAAMNSELTGQSDSQFYDRLVNLVTGSSNEGASVELTIDPELQQAAYDALPNGFQGTVIATDPRTGAIRAMASKPSYDTNELAVHSTRAAQQNLESIMETPGLNPNVNPAVGHLVAPGSTFKLLDLVAAFESGKYTPETEMENPDKMTLPGTRTQLGNFEEGICEQRTRATLDFIVAQSCNTPFVAMSLDVGQEALRDVTERFGFGQQLGIPMKVTPSVFPAELSEAELGLSSIGQFDVKTTPLQMNMVAMGLANDGVIMKPNLVERVVAPDLRVVDEPEPEQFSTATSAEVANQITGLMRGPVESGTARAARVPGVDLAAKTGTAQIGDSGDVNAWITGFAPADDPEIAITVVVERIPYADSRGLTSSIMKTMQEAVFNK